MSDGADLPARRRARCAVAVLLIGLVVAFVPGLAAEQHFVRAVETFACLQPGPGSPTYRWVELDAPDEQGGRASTAPVYTWNGIQPVQLVPIWGTSALELVRRELGWAAAAATLAIIPLLFACWRFGNASFGRSAGVACAAVACISVCVLVGRMTDSSRLLPGGFWWTVPVGGALMAAAFLVAPPPRPRDDT